MSTDINYTEPTKREQATDWSDRLMNGLLINKTVEQVKVEAVEMYEEMLEVKEYLSISRDKLQTAKRECQSQIDTIEEFIKSHIADNRSASVEDLKALAEELDIELCKKVKVTFNVDVEYELTVPLEFNMSSIDATDFSVETSFSGNNDFDAEETICDISDFDVESAE